MVAPSSVQHGIPRPVHASDVRNWSQCRRLAVFGRRTERQPARAGSSAALGTLVHLAMERFVKLGELPSEQTQPGRIALELVPHVPADTLGAEVPFSVTFRGYPLEGTIDLFGRSELTDWKTTGDWTRRPATLAGDPQATLYSYAVAASGGPEAIPLRWVYVHTRTLQVRPLAARIDPERVVDFAPVIETLIELDVRGVEPLTLPGNREHCSRFGGCAFRPLCGAEPMADRVDRVAFRVPQVAA
jgi:hypothetical protein